MRPVLHASATCCALTRSSPASFVIVRATRRARGTPRALSSRARCAASRFNGAIRRRSARRSTGSRPPNRGVPGAPARCSALDNCSIESVTCSMRPTTCAIPSRVQVGPGKVLADGRRACMVTIPARTSALSMAFPLSRRPSNKLTRVATESRYVGRRCSCRGTGFATPPPPSRSGSAAAIRTGIPTSRRPRARSTTGRWWCRSRAPGS